MTIAALHHTFENLVMKGLVEIRFHLAVTANAQVWLTYRQQMNSREVGFFGVRSVDIGYRLRNVPVTRSEV